MNLSPGSGPPYSDSFYYEFSAPAPYQLVQAGFAAYWSSLHYLLCEKQPVENELVQAINRTIQQIPLDPVLQPELALERIFIPERRLHPNGNVVVLLEFMSKATTPLLWYPGGLTSIEKGSGMLAVVSSPHSDSYRLQVHLDDTAFQADLAKLEFYEIGSESLSVPVCLQIAENTLQHQQGNPDVTILNVQREKDFFRLDTSEGFFRAQFCCHVLSKMLTCILKPPG